MTCTCEDAQDGVPCARHPESACQPKGIIRIIQEKRPGQRCPRVELDPVNLGAASVAGYLIDPTLRSLAPAMFDATTYEEQPETRRRLLVRIANAIHSPEVNRILHPPPKPRDPKTGR